YSVHTRNEFRTPGSGFEEASLVTAVAGTRTARARLAYRTQDLHANRSIARASAAGTRPSDAKPVLAVGLADADTQQVAERVFRIGTQGRRRAEDRQEPGVVRAKDSQNSRSPRLPFGRLFRQTWIGVEAGAFHRKSTMDLGRRRHPRFPLAPACRRAA